MSEIDRLLIATRVLELLERRRGKSICPSEVARDLYEDDWRERMELVRDTGFLMKAEGLIEITQEGNPVPRDHKGPIRFGPRR